MGHKAGRLVGWVFVKGGGGVGWARSPFAACVVRSASSGQRCPAAGWSGSGLPFNGLVLVDHSSASDVSGVLWRVWRCLCGWCLHGHTGDQRSCFDVGVGKIPPGREPDPGRSWGSRAGQSWGAGPGGLGGAGSGASRYAEGRYRIVGTRRRLPLDSTMSQGSDDNKTGHSTPLI